MKTYTEYDIREVKKVLEDYCEQTERNEMPQLFNQLIDFMISRTPMYRHYEEKIQRASEDLNHARCEMAEFKKSL